MFNYWKGKLSPDLIYIYVSKYYVDSGKGNSHSKGGSNRSGIFAQIALKNNCEYKATDGLITPDLQKVVKDYFFYSF